MLRSAKLRHLALRECSGYKLTDDVLYALEASVGSLEELRLCGATGITHAGWGWLTAAMVKACGAVPLVVLDLSGKTCPAEWNGDENQFAVSDEWLCSLRAPRLESLWIDLGFNTLPPLHDDKVSRLGVSFGAVVALFRANVAAWIKRFHVAW